MSDISEPDDIVTRIMMNSKICRSRQEYTIPDEVAIIRFIVDNRRFSELKGNVLWKDMEKSGTINRSWQSLKEHFLKKVLPRLTSFNLSHEVLRKFELHTQNDRGDSSESNNDTVEPEVVETQLQHPKKKANRSFTPNEDLEILKYILSEKDRINQINGMLMWKRMAWKEVIKERSWHSLKERFRKRILPKISSYLIPEEYQQNLNRLCLLHNIQIKRKNPNQNCCGIATKKPELRIVENGEASLSSPLRWPDLHPKKKKVDIVMSSDSDNASFLAEKNGDVASSKSCNVDDEKTRNDSAANQPDFSVADEDSSSSSVSLKLSKSYSRKRLLIVSSDSEIGSDNERNNDTEAVTLFEKSENLNGKRRNDLKRSKSLTNNKPENHVSGNERHSHSNRRLTLDMNKDLPCATRKVSESSKHILDDEMDKEMCSNKAMNSESGEMITDDAVCKQNIENDISKDEEETGVVQEIANEDAIQEAVSSSCEFFTPPSTLRAKEKTCDENLSNTMESDTTPSIVDFQETMAETIVGTRSTLIEESEKASSDGCLNQESLALISNSESTSNYRLRSSNAMNSCDTNETKTDEFLDDSNDAYDEALNPRQRLIMKKGKSNMTTIENSDLFDSDSAATEIYFSESSSHSSNSEHVQEDSVQSALRELNAIKNFKEIRIVAEAKRIVSVLQRLLGIQTEEVYFLLEAREGNIGAILDDIFSELNSVGD